MVYVAESGRPAATLRAITTATVTTWSLSDWDITGVAVSYPDAVYVANRIDKRVVIDTATTTELYRRHPSNASRGFWSATIPSASPSILRNARLTWSTAEGVELRVA